MAIQWDTIIVKKYYFSINNCRSRYLETWIQKKTQQRKEKEMLKQILMFVSSDLQGKLRFVEESIQYKDYKPFFTNLWDAVILSGRHALLPFEKFQDLEHTYSWMKYYNTELQGSKVEENVLKDILEEVLLS